MQETKLQLKKGKANIFTCQVQTHSQKVSLIANAFNYQAIDLLCSED